MRSRFRAPSSRKGIAKGPNSVLRAEMARVPGIFLVQILVRVCLLIQKAWYGVQAVPNRPGLGQA